MRSRGSVGSDSRVSGADWVSIAAILPGPVQAWPRPGPAQTPPPAATARAAPQPLVQVCYVTARTAPPTGRIEGAAPGKAPPPPRGPQASAVGPAASRIPAPLRCASSAGCLLFPVTSPALSPPTPVPKLAHPGPLSAFVPKDFCLPGSL